LGKARPQSLNFDRFEQQSCSELTGFRVQSERCCGGLERLRRLGDLALPAIFVQAGLRWCGGWRRANFRGSHDQVQIEDEGCYPISRTKDQ
jgi:hypothetical protein